MDTLGVTTMFTAYTDFKILPGSTPFLNCEFHQTAYASSIDTRERVVPEQAGLQVFNQEPRLGVIA